MDDARLFASAEEDEWAAPLAALIMDIQERVGRAPGAARTRATHKHQNTPSSLRAASKNYYNSKSF